MKFKLVVIGGKKDGLEIPISTPTFLIGRGNECQVRPQSPLVNHIHCQISVDNGSVAIEDCSTAIGTLVNGEKIKWRHNLSNGDRITVGPLQFEVQLTAEKGDEKKDRPKNIYSGGYERSVAPPSALSAAIQGASADRGLARASDAIRTSAENAPAECDDDPKSKAILKSEGVKLEDADMLLLSTIGMMLLVVLAMVFGITEWHLVEGDFIDQYPPRFYWGRTVYYIGQWWEISWVRWGVPAVLLALLSLFLMARAALQRRG